MYFVNNPVSFRVSASIDRKLGTISFLNSSIVALCAPGKNADEKLPFEILRITRLADCRLLEDTYAYWSIEDVAEMGNGRLVKITFHGEQFTEDFLAPRTGQTQKSTEADRAQRDKGQPEHEHSDAEALYEALLGEGRLSLLIAIQGREDPERVDGLIIDLDYVERSKVSEHELPQVEAAG